MIIYINMRFLSGIKERQVIPEAYLIFYSNQNIKFINALRFLKNNPLKSAKKLLNFL